MSEQLQNCRRCNGTGRSKKHPSGGFGLNPGNRMVEMRCWVCGGTGKTKGYPLPHPREESRDG